MRKVLVAVLAATAVLALSAGSAFAGFGITDFDGEVVDGVAAGNPVAATQAGSHPEEASTTFDLARTTLSTAFGPLWVPDGASMRRVTVDLPVGFVGNPMAVAKCTEGQLMAATLLTKCPLDSQVGIAEVRLDESFGLSRFVPLFSMVTPDDVPAAFAFKVSGVPVHLRARVRSDSDMGISIDVRNISQALPVYGSKITLWGDPASPAHDGLRGSCMNLFNGTPTGNSCPSGAPRVAFLTNPTTCTGPVRTDLSIASWRGDVDASFFTTHEVGDRSALVGASGCAQVPFEPALSAVPVRAQVGAPSGFAVDLTVPQSGDPAGIAQAHVKKVVVRLPEGVGVSPAAADGLGACADELTKLGTGEMPACPESSKIGSVSVETPLLASPLEGAVYLRSPQPGNLFRLLIAVKGPGVVIKLAGEARPDSRTGQITATFDDNPQLPFSKLHLAFKDGPRAPLVNPAECGTYTTTTEFTAWNGKTASSSSSFTVSRDGAGAACAPRGFAPSLRAGSQSAVAGAYSPFVLSVARSDGDQELASIERVSLPAGLLGKVSSVPLCAEVQAAAGTCGAASRIGGVLVTSGSGIAPLGIPQAGKTATGVYLAGPYKGAPYSMSIVVPAQAGPFDLGTVVMRSALHVDPKDAHITALTDPMPHILEGVSLQIREVRLLLDRPGFMFNPTSCAHKQIEASLVSVQGTRADASSRFQVGECHALPISPVITATGGGKGLTKRFQHPALKVTVRQTPAQAHLAIANVVLPQAFNVDLNAPSLKAACPREVYAQDKCSRTAIVGTVKAITPVFAEPLTGPAFLLQKKGQLPDIVMRLENVHYRIDLIGVLDFLGDSRVITRVQNVPDAPITSFELNIRGGKGGSLLNRRDLCARKAATQATFKGQNGKVVVKSPTTRITGCAKAKAAARRGRAAATRRSSAAGSQTATARATRAVRGTRASDRAAGGRS